jgi:hypothetical protein
VLGNQGRINGEEKSLKSVATGKQFDKVWGADPVSACK